MNKLWKIFDRATGIEVGSAYGKTAREAFGNVRPSLALAFNGYTFEEVPPRSPKQTTADRARRGRRVA